MPFYFWLALVILNAPFLAAWQADGGLERLKNEARHWRRRFQLWRSKRALDRLDRELHNPK
jgi:hypothetical protein